jgi:hypothetical protein
VVFSSVSESVKVFYHLFIYIAVGDSVIKRGRLGFHYFVTHHIFVPVSSQDLDFQRQMSWSFLCSVSSVKLRGYCWTCWCLWNWWPSLFKLPFHKTKIKGYAECIMIWQQQVYKNLLLHQFYCNLVWFEKTITDRRNPLELYLNPIKQSNKRKKCIKYVKIKWKTNMKFRNSGAINKSSFSILN